MRRFLFFLGIVALFFTSCHNNETIENPQVDREWVFNGLDTVVDDYAYVAYLPISEIDSNSYVVPIGKYIRYHRDDTDTIGLIFNPNYIRTMCIYSNCFELEKEDTIFGYGNVREYSFPEAYLSFAYDEWEEMIVYSTIQFGDDVWYTEIESDGITATSDIEKALWEEIPYLPYTVRATTPIYSLEEGQGASVDTVYHKEIKVWDLMRNFQPENFFAIQRDSLILYQYPERDFHFAKYVESGHLYLVSFGGDYIRDTASLQLLESIFLEKLEDIPVNQDYVVFQD